MKKALLLALFAGLLASACKKTSVDPAEGQAKAKANAVERYAELAFKNYDAVYAEAVKLQTAIGAFLASPSQASLEAAKTAWLAARLPYSRSEPFRFYGGPIDGGANGAPESLINSWPVDESYIDLVTGGGDSSIIARFAPASITKDTLIALNARGGETNIATGYHAIEFLLWGQDKSTTGPGARPYTDYTTAFRADSRKAYLHAVTELLVQNLKQVRDAWVDGAPYRVQLTQTMTPDEVLALAFTGMGSLAKGETGGERTRVALSDSSQEDEQDCFSDNTTYDLQRNVEGILNVYTGKFQPADGTPADSGASFYQAIAAIDQAKADAALAAMTKALTAVRAIPSPFDQAIRQEPGRSLVLATADDLSTVSDRLVDAAYAYKIIVKQ